jgi:hypothetical protein
MLCVIISSKVTADSAGYSQVAKPKLSNPADGKPVGKG